MDTHIQIYFNHTHIKKIAKRYGFLVRLRHFLYHDKEKQVLTWIKKYININPNPTGLVYYYCKALILLSYTKSTQKSHIECHDLMITAS